MPNNIATQKMIQNILDGTTPLSMKGYLNSVPVGGIVMFDRFVNVPEIAAGAWEQMTGAFPFFAGGGSIEIGATGGEETHTLTVAEMPSHTHRLNYGNVDGAEHDVRLIDFTSGIGFVGNDDYSVVATGEGAAHNNMPPYIGICAWRRIE